MYLVACMVVGPHHPGFLSMEIPERMHIQESPTHDTGAEACCSG